MLMLRPWPPTKESFSSWCQRPTPVRSQLQPHCEVVSQRSRLTAGCTQQACGFRDIYPDFTSLNFDVYCLSADKPAAQSKWQTKVSFDNHR